MDNLEEMNRFLEKFNLPRLNQEDIEMIWTSQLQSLNIFYKEQFFLIYC